MSPITSAAVPPIEWKRLALFAALSGLFGLIITAYALMVMFYAVLVTFGGAYPFLVLIAWILSALLLAWAVTTVLLLVRSRFGLLLMMSLSVLKAVVYTLALLLTLGAGNFNPARLGRGLFILAVVPPRVCRGDLGLLDALPPSPLRTVAFSLASMWAGV